MEITSKQNPSSSESVKMNYFNEIFSQDGKIKPHYSKVHSSWNTIPIQERQNLQMRSKRLLSGDYQQDLHPRIITHTEFQLLSQGVQQRARAILTFLQDYCQQGDRWSRILPKTLLTAIIHRHHSENYLKLITNGRVAFPYGPDIIRTSTGQWKVIEDSAGIIGGLGDLVHSRKILFQLIPKYRDYFLRKTSVNNPQDFFAELATYYKEKSSFKVFLSRN